MQGWRVTMEDAHAAILDLTIPENLSDYETIEQLNKEKADNNKELKTEANKRVAFFGVYDGHGGKFTDEKNKQDEIMLCLLWPCLY